MSPRRDSSHSFFASASTRLIVESWWKLLELPTFCVVSFCFLCATGFTVLVAGEGILGVLISLASGAPPFGRLLEDKVDPRLKVGTIFGLLSFPLGASEVCVFCGFEAKLAPRVKLGTEKKDLRRVTLASLS